jgi:RNA polymerase sigma-70 factor (ECF subfamily)
MTDVAAEGSDFVEFHAATFPRIFRTALRLAGGDRHVAYDATQDAYAMMLQRWPQRRTHLLEDNRRYLMRAALNRVYDHYRRERRLTEFDDAYEAATEDPNLVVLLDDRGLVAAVRRFLDGQPPRRRSVAVLRFVEGYEYAEIASILGMSESTVRTHVERVRVLLKPYVERIIEQTGGGDQS